LPENFATTTTPTSCYGLQYEDGSLTIIALSTLRLPYQYSLSAAAYQNSGFYDSLGYGTYNAQVRDDSGCITPVNDIVVDEAAEGILSISPTDTSIALGQSVQLIVSLYPYGDAAINTYSWSPYMGLNCTDCGAPVVTSYAPFNLFNLAITYNGHCITSDSAIVRVEGSPQIFIPDVFTPNGDGMNDVFYVYGNDISSLVLKVFNRWGEKVFEGHDQFAGWDGMYKGAPSPIGVYVWEATIYTLSGQTIFKRGSVTLVR
jgi:gliding motility-associated-like protein